MGGWELGLQAGTQHHQSLLRVLDFTSAGSILNVSVSDHDRSDSLLLSWAEPEGGARGYLLALSSLGSGTLLQNVSAGPNTTSFWFHGLTPGTRYEIEVTAMLACRDTTSHTITAQTSKGSPVLLPVIIMLFGVLLVHGRVGLFLTFTRSVLAGSPES